MPVKSALLRTGLSVFLAIDLFFFILTCSIGLPIYIRPFYYAHIDTMDLPERSGYSAEQIRQAYDEVLDYLTLPGGVEFGTGDMAYSPEGESHFADCKVLFDLNATILLTSGAILLLLFLLRRKLGPYCLGKRSAAFYSALAAVILPLVIGGLAALDFDRAFVVFHSIFFPGKDNWIFDWYADEIIRVLPQDFFMHCAMLIGGGVLAFAVGILVWEIFSERKRQAL